MLFLSKLFALWVLADEGDAFAESLMPAPRAGLAGVGGANLLYFDAIFSSLVGYHVLQLVVRPVAQHELLLLVGIAVPVLTEAREVFHVDSGSTRFNGEIFVAT